jgi:hypothetical protein
MMMGVDRKNSWLRWISFVPFNHSLGAQSLGECLVAETLRVRLRPLRHRLRAVFSVLREVRRGR